MPLSTHAGRETRRLSRLLSVSVEAYLCVTPHEGVYPSEHYADFEPEEHILARAADITPLLWLAMFRPGDLRDVPTRT